jgi:hypothetical protein
VRLRIEQSAPFAVNDQPVADGRRIGSSGLPPERVRSRKNSASSARCAQTPW